MVFELLDLLDTVSPFVDVMLEPQLNSVSIDLLFFAFLLMQPDHHLETKKSEGEGGLERVKGNRLKR